MRTETTTTDWTTRCVVVVAAALFLVPAVGAGEPVCHWDSDGRFDDDAGTVQDTLTVQGAASARFVDETVVPGVRGKAVALNVEPGDASHLVAANSADIRLGSSYTIEAWIHPAWSPRQVAPWQRLVLNWGAGRYAYHLAIHNGVVSLYHGQADGSYVFAEGGRVDAGRWQHVAGIARRNDAEPGKSRLEVYLDGQLTATGTYDGTVRKLEKEGVGLGDSADVPAQAARFRGYLDDVWIWNEALQPAQVRKHHAARAAALAKIARAPQNVPPIKAPLADQFDASGVEEIVFCEREPGRDLSGHYYANFGYACIDPSIWLHGADGARLCKLNPKTGALSVLLADPGGAVRDPCVHYGGKKVLFAYRKGGTHHYNLYEIDADGQNLRQLTDGPWDDVEPTYVPDGGIVFASTRCKRYILCWLAQTATLHRCDADGSNIRMLSSNTVTENTPCVLPDGRILYTRWEYVNRDAVVFHHLWTMNPDGTGTMVYFGNMHPGGVFIDAQPIAGTRDVVFINSPGHGRNEHQGRVAIVSDRLGPDERSAVRNLTQGRDFRDPYPLSPETFLVAKGNQILLLGRGGRTQTVYTGRQMVHEPRPLAARMRERTVPTRMDPTAEDATMIVADVYFGRNMGGVERGAIKKLLVLEDLPKPANYHGGGSQPLGHGVSSTLKRILGTVPVEADGSAHFTVPPMRSIYLALLDENDLSVKQMRSFVTLQPGETASCVGCHEPRLQSPAGGSPMLAALNRPPSRVTPIPGVPDVMDFPRDIQPILDRHCTKCHSSRKRAGGLVLTGDRGPVYSLSYYSLLLHWQVKDTRGAPKHGSGRQHGNDAPYTTYSSASPLMKKIDGSHHGVKLTPAEHGTVRLWIDVNAPYPGTVAALGTGQVGGCWGNNRPVRVMADAWPSAKAAAAAVQRRCVACHGKWLPKHVTDRVPLNPWRDMLAWTRPLSRFSRHRIFNLTYPDQSLILRAPLAKTTGGYAKGKQEQRKVLEDRSKPPRSVTHPVVFADTNDPDFRTLLEHVREAGARLDEIKRFEMPGFRPSEHYVREMKRYGVLPQNLSADAPVDPYATDHAYWRSFWHRP